MLWVGVTMLPFALAGVLLAVAVAWSGARAATHIAQTGVPNATATVAPTAAPSTGAAAAAGAAVGNYFTAVGGHNWAVAQRTLARDLRARTTVSQLQLLWGRREAANGRVTSFVVEDVQVTVAGGSQTALVTGTVTYTSGFGDLKVVRVLDEADGWHLTTLP